MERTIGNLGQQICQPSKPYANLALEGVRCSQVNALLAIMPELDSPSKSLPHGSINVGDGYVLLRKCSKYPVSPNGTKWVWLLLPNGQIARLAWRETLKSEESLQVSRNIKFIDGTKVHIASDMIFSEIFIFIPF
ncbi:hypothetical protein OG21DRAFT_1528114 [Imleria badia]|nr:hypothetical protein OG21DRAFT_1528114 [Imleria badia]